jgi:hypothetical protein
MRRPEGPLGVLIADSCVSGLAPYRLEVGLVDSAMSSPS